MKYISGARIITENSVLEKYVLGFDENFSLIIPEAEFEPGNGEVIKADGLFAAPGLIDVHIHGSGGKDTMEGTVEALETISSSVVKNGVTTFLATTMTMDIASIKRAFDAIRKGMKQKLPGAQLYGAHMEGPFINESFKGAQDAKYIIGPDFKLVDEYSDVIKLVTVAPELPGALELISALRDIGIISSAGHSAADQEEMTAGVKAGITHSTHLFNAMTGVHHRTPGVALVALTQDIYCELIADGIHVNPGVFELVWRAKGPHRITLVTDCIEAGGMGDGEFSLGGQKVFVKDCAARLEDGTLAGSVLKLNQGLRNFYENTGAELWDVFKMGALNPAIELGIQDRRGSIAIGKAADFLLMDEGFNVKATYIKGQCIYKAT